MMSHRSLLGMVGLALVGAASCDAAPPPPPRCPTLPSPPKVEAAPPAPPTDDLVRVSPQEEASERAWLTSLGIAVPAGPLLRPEPYAEPFGARSFVAPTAWYRVPAPEKIAADAMRADLPILHRIMEKAYGGWTSAESRGLIWSDWFKRWDASLAAKSGRELVPEEALFAWKTLMDVQLDNHSGPVHGPRWNSGSRTAILASEPARPCLEMTTDKGTFPLDPGDLAQVPRHAQRFDPATKRMQRVSYLSYPARRGALAAITCGDASIAAEPAWDGPVAERIKSSAELNRTTDDGPGFRVIEPGFATMRLPTFSKRNGARLEAMMAGLPASIDDLRVLIFDLRFNDGGDAPVQALLSRWLAPPVLVSITQWTRETRKSCLYASLRWGYTQVSSQGLAAPLSQGVHDMLAYGLQESMAPAPEGCPVRVVTEKASQPFAQHATLASPPRKGPLFLVLTDNYCGSDCELMVSTLARLPQTVVAGTNTYGVAQFIQPGYFVLPHTRVPFRIALGHSDQYGDGRSFDGYGLDVDVLLATQEANRAEGVLALAHALAARPARSP